MSAHDLKRASGQIAEAQFRLDRTSRLGSVLHGGGTHSGQYFDLSSVTDGIASRLIMGEQFQCLSFVLGYWSHRLIAISNVSARGDPTINAEYSPGRRGNARMLAGDFPGQLRIKLPHRFDRQFGPTFMPIFKPHKAALERMNFLDRQRLCKPQDNLR